MGIVLTISICLNVFQAFVFWFGLYGLYTKEQKEKAAVNEELLNDAIERVTGEEQ